MRKLIPLTLLYVVLLAQSQLLSPIPVPSTVIIDLDPEPYDDAMLETALANGKVFTFIAKSKHTKNPELSSLRQSYMTLFSLTHRIYTTSAFRLAFIVPYKVIGKYAYSTSNTALGYLLNRGIPFEMELFAIDDEENTSLQSALDTIDEKRFDLVVAPVTQKGASYLCSQNGLTKIFIPTLHKNRIECDNEKVYFGGIDYTGQIETLSYLVESNATTVTVSDNSAISRMLSQTVYNIVDVDDTIVLGQSGYYKDLILKHEDLNQSTIFLNTPVVKSSLFLSQLTLADYKPQQVLSTQINYSPLLLTLTQYHDRENMVLASSIGPMDSTLTENIALINQDIRFNWLNYATIAGIDNEFSISTSEERLANEVFVDGSLEYNVYLYEAGLYRFVPKEVPYPAEERIETIEEQFYSPDSQDEMSE
ncbi:hypothetical protein [Hydrogenimonas cancrithermarum]|uniref:DDE transposase n=1 Tax=Hydrogenimonas cancrithermarum TaxID=2993563 RepID=A0ABM8FHR5_9BACT|nr:hypothetical protein [Hydrogenimonas cancrithermarum]BDY11827.1 DDE transposase [Hydrogenimonas cancrithermarum]